jgi:uncharacterized protein
MRVDECTVYEDFERNMIHPSTELRFIGPEVGYGVFSTALIPKGTITYVEDELEVRIPEQQFLSFQPQIQEVLDKYSYIDANGVRIMSWDFAKYVNHNCNFNTITTGYGFEIAIRDIQPGEELTDEYGIFNLDYPMKCYCGSANCRGMVKPEDFDDYYLDWDRLALDALVQVQDVAQPLWSLIAPELVLELHDYLQGVAPFKSVYTMRRKSAKAAL